MNDILFAGALMRHQNLVIHVIQSYSTEFVSYEVYPFFHVLCAYEFLVYFHKLKFSWFPLEYVVMVLY
jgi:hypothetical protein